MSEQAHPVTPDHLRRDAYLYVRQATIGDELSSRARRQRQYALCHQAVCLGWPNERVVVIDCDLGQSGTRRDREGFQTLVTDVSMGRVGIVLALDTSRLTRNARDWYGLLEICATSRTLVLVDNCLYAPEQDNHRRLLGLERPVAETKLHGL